MEHFQFRLLAVADFATTTARHAVGSSLLSWCGVVVLLLFPFQTAKAETLPNIVFLLADDLGYGELGCYGQQWIKTPNIDRIASEGIKFTDFYAGNAVCAPSRCCLMTGKHPGRAYIRDNGDPKDLQHLKSRYGWEFPGQNPIPDSEVTIAELLKTKGYKTAAIGKWGLGHFGTTGDPNKQGFDLFYGFNCQRHAHNHYPRFLWRNDQKEVLPGNDRTLHGETYSQDKFTEVAIEFMRENKDSPFFLYMPYAIPHLSIQVPDESLQQYKDKIPEEDYEHRGYLRHPHPRAGYAAMISHLDRDVGKIMDELKRLGLDDNTLVIFTSDNGPTYDRLGGSDSDFFRSAPGMRGLKGSLYEGGIKVPMVARWPGKIQPQTTSNRIAAFWDVMPTVAELTGAELPNASTGKSFLSELQGGEANQPDYLYWEFPAYGGQQAIRQGRWKAMRQNLKRENKDARRVELYDLESDPAEANDLAEEKPELVAKLASLMDRARVPSERFSIAALDGAEKPKSVRPGINKNFVAADIQVEEWVQRFEVESREIYAARLAALEAINLKPGDVVADIGAGTGLFTRLFSSAVGEEGHVLALDISNAFLTHLRERVKEDGLTNVSVMRNRADSVALSPSSVDVAFICDTYHHFEYPNAMLQSLHQALRPKGQLIVIDFDRIPGQSREWVLGHVRANKKTFRHEIEKAGFRFVKEHDVEGLKENYFLRFER